MTERWEHQEEALKFALSHPRCMLDMDMGTGKTRVAIETVFGRDDVKRVVVVCPSKAIELKVWETNLRKFAPHENYAVWSMPVKRGNANKKAEELSNWMDENGHKDKLFILVSYGSVWRGKLGDLFLRREISAVILDESHKAKGAGSKTSKYLGVLGRRVKYKMCLTGTPMANSPLDIYGQFRFLDSNIFGTSYEYFKACYCIEVTHEGRTFPVGFKNQQDLNNKFQSVTYSCKMEDVKDRIKLPDHLPPVIHLVDLPSKDMKMIDELNNEFLASCNDGVVVVNNVITKLIRLQQVSAGFCMVQSDVFDVATQKELNTAKIDALVEILSDISPTYSVVVFCLFKHDIRSVERAAKESGREFAEISGDRNTYAEWEKAEGGVIAVQIQAGAEAIDLTKSHYAVYFSLPHSLYLYSQSKSRLYRPGQKHPVSFIHLIANDTIDVSIYSSLQRKEDIIESIKSGDFDFGYLKKGSGNRLIDTENLVVV